MVFEHSPLHKTVRCFSVVALLHVCTVNIAAPSTSVDNAALLYYQATFVRPEAKDYRAFNHVLAGGDPNGQVREYFGRRATREAISLVEAATQTPRCDWGIRSFQGDELSVPASVQLQRLTNLLDVYARILAHDGRYRAALEKCLMIRRFANHMGSVTPNTHQSSKSFDTEALVSIKSILDRMPADAETLVWLQSRLKEVPGTLWQPAATLTGFREHCVNWLLHEHPDIGVSWKKMILSSTVDENVKKRIGNLTGDELFQRGCESYDVYLKSVLEIMDSDRPYAEKRAELRRMTADLRERGMQGDPVGILVDCMYNPTRVVVSYYESMVRHRANFDMTMVAIEIYLVKARTGQLPTVLPPDLPKDPYTGKDFEYMIINDGFELQYRTKGDIGETVRPFEFAVR